MVTINELKEQWFKACNLALRELRRKRLISRKDRFAPHEWEALVRDADRLIVSRERSLKDFGRALLSLAREYMAPQIEREELLEESAMGRLENEINHYLSALKQDCPDDEEDEQEIEIQDFPETWQKLVACLEASDKIGVLEQLGEMLSIMRAEMLKIEMPELKRNPFEF